MSSGDNAFLAESKRAFLSIALASTFMFPTLFPSPPVFAAAAPQINEAETFKVLKVSAPQIPAL